MTAKIVPLPQDAPATTSTWPVPGDVPDLNIIIDDQATTITAQEALLHAYQGVLNTAQTPPPATGSGTSTGTTSLVMTAVTGVIVLGSTVTGVGVPAGTTIVGQTAGTPGGAGTYTTNQVTTLSAIALTFTPGGGASPWPVPQDQVTLNTIVQQQTALLRVQTALIQHYQDLLNTSQTTAPPTGP